MDRQWMFVIAAYGVTFAGTVAVIAYSWLKMRSNERAVDRLRGGDVP
jgi:hypothetical protein